MSFLKFLFKIIGYFALGFFMIIGIVATVAYIKVNHAMNIVSEVETTYTKEFGKEIKNITIKNNEVYIDGVLIKRLDK